VVEKPSALRVTGCEWKYGGESSARGVAKLYVAGGMLRESQSRIQTQALRSGLRRIFGTCDLLGSGDEWCSTVDDDEVVFQQNFAAG
jgi:hypothetical protein